MPFSCRATGGDVALTASATQAYDIVGRREQRAYTACREKGAPDCKTMMLHRFSISCGGVSVPWFKVASKIRNDAIGGSWIDGDQQLNLLMRTTKGKMQRTARFVMPEGFAPVAELGVAFNQAAVPAMVAAPPPEPTIGPETPSPHEEAALAADAADAAVAAAVEKVTGLPRTRTANSEGSWQTVVYQHDAAAVVRSEAFGLEFMFTLMALALTAALATYGFATGKLRPALGMSRVAFAASRGAVQQWWRTATTSRQLRADNETFYNGVDSVAALLLQVESAVRSLQAAGPLRETLSGELKIIRQRLASLQRSESELSEARASANLRAIVRDLERVRRIADSAAISMTPAKQAGGDWVPKTQAEAYELLGINASVSEATLKKIVDGLRMSWHPDLARDEADRSLREERTKCINIAWDLITGKRDAA